MLKLIFYRDISHYSSNACRLQEDDYDINYSRKKVRFGVASSNYKREINIESYENKEFEQESQMILGTFKILYPGFIRAYNRDINNEELKDLMLDFSPLANGLGKIFELEVNLSVVHWIRNEEPTIFQSRTL